jgi:hypothetical protein
MASKLPSYQQFFQNAKNSVSSVLQPLGQKLLEGGAAVQNVIEQGGQRAGAVLNDLQQNPNNYNIFANMNQIAPQPKFGSWGYKAMEPFESAQNWIDSPNRSDLLPMINAQTPILGRAGAFGRGLLNIPATLGNTVIGHGVLDPSLDLGRNIFKAGTGQQLTGYEQNKSPITRFGYQVGSLLNPDAGQELGVNTNAQNWIGNAAGIANPILTAWNLQHSAPILGKGAPLLDRMISGAQFGAKTGFATGGLQGLEDNRNQSLDQQFMKSIGQATTSGVLGGIFGAAVPAVSDAGGYLFNKAKDVLKDQNGFMSLGGTPTSELDDMLQRLPDGEVPKSGSIEGKYMNADVNEVIYKMQQGAKPMDLMHQGYSSGALQEASQRLQGYGLLADLDEAIKAKDAGDVKRIAQQISQDPKYAQYIPQLKDYLSQFVDDFGTPNPAAPGVKDIMSNEQGFVKMPGTGESIFRKGAENFTDNADMTYQERFNMPVLKKLNAGSDRVVYDLGDNVIKVAKNARGLVQNSNELDWYAQDQGLIPKIVEQGKDYVVMQKVDPPDAATKEFVKQLGQFSAEDWRLHSGPLQDLLEKYDMTDLMNYDPLVGDLGRIKNWGTLDGKPILVDGGTLSGSFVQDFTGAGQARSADSVAEWKKDFSSYKKINKAAEQPPYIEGVSLADKYLDPAKYKAALKDYQDKAYGIAKDQRGFVDFGAKVGDQADNNNPLPWESGVHPGMGNDSGPDVAANMQMDKSRIMTQDDVQQNLTQGEAGMLDSANKGNFLTRTWNAVFNPMKNAPSDLQSNVQNWRGDKLLGHSQANDLADYFANEFKGAGDDDLFKLTQYMQNPSDQTAQRLGLSSDLIQKYQPAMDNMRSIYDDLFKEATDKGLSPQYLNNYVSQVWEESPAQIQQKLSSLSGKPYFTKDRIIPDYETGLKAGLTPKYTNPSAIIAHYQDALDSALANKQLATQLEKSGYLVPANQAPPDWKIISAPLFPKAQMNLGPDKIMEVPYAAPPNVATPINNIFDRTPNGALHFLANVSGNLQNVTLSGGIPGTPVNAYAAGQVIKEGTAGKVTTPLTAIANSYSDGAANKYFESNQQFLNMMAQEDIPLSTSYDYANRFKNVIKEDTLSGKIQNGFHEMVDNPTFQRFYPILQVDTFKNVYNQALQNGASPQEAQALAGGTVKNFYGVVDEVSTGRNANVSEAMKAFFFAPKFREAMVNLWTNTAKAVWPTNWQDKTLSSNRNFAAGVVGTYTLFNLLNYKMNGRAMWDNPEGKEFTLMIPTAPDSVFRGKTLGIPILPSVATLPRMAGSAALDVAKGDPKAAIGELRKSASMLFKPALDVAANEDYFGRQIYDPKNPDAMQNYSKMGGYLFQQYVLAHPYLKTAYDLFVNKKDMSPIEVTSTALELPVRFYNPDSTTTSLFFEKYNKFKPYAEQYKQLGYDDPAKAQDYYTQNKDKIDQFNSLAPIVSAYYQLKDKGQTAQAVNLLKSQTGENSGGSDSPSDNQSYLSNGAQDHPFMGNGSQSNNPEDVFAEEENTRKMMQLFYQSGYVNPQSTLTKDKMNQIAQQNGVKPADLYWKYVGGLNSNARAKYLNGYFEQAANQDDANKRLLTVIDKDVLSNGVVDDMTQAGYINPDQASYLKDVIKARKNVNKGIPAAGKPKKGKAAPKFKINTSKISAPKRITLGSTKFKLKDVAPKPIKTKRLA